MVDRYHATLDDYSRVALQFISYHNYLKGCGGGTGPRRSLLQLQHANRSGNSSRVVKLVDEISIEVGVNTRVPHFEGERVFGFAKRKLDLLPSDESDFHRHDRINYSIPKLGNRSVLQLKGVNATQSSIDPGTSNLSISALLVCTRSGLPILEMPCSNPMAWRIERISSSASNVCQGYTSNGSKCNAKIAKYRKAVATPTFSGIQRIPKSMQTQQM